MAIVHLFAGYICNFLCLQYPIPVKARDMSAVNFSQVVQPEKAEEEDTKEKETPTERDTQTQSQSAQT